MIYIIDAPCGAGKTSAMINHINRNNFEKYLFVTPFLSETQRIKKECKHCKMNDPKDAIKGSKTYSFYSLVRNKKNIVTTHSLFFRLNEDIRRIEEKSYNLIIDEVPDLIKQVYFNYENGDFYIGSPEDEASATGRMTKEFKQKIKDMREMGMIDINNNNRLNWIRNNYKGMIGMRFKELLESGNIYYHNNSLIWCYNPDYFLHFKDVYILTYMFDAQIVKSYLDMYKFEYEYLFVNMNNNTYEFTDKFCKYDTQKYGNNIYVYEGVLNNIGDSKYDLSKTWCSNKGKFYNERVEILKNNMYNYSINITRAKSEDILWTCFKDNYEDLKRKGYTKGYLACNARATNEFSDRHIVMYPINRFLNPIIENFLRSKGVPIDIDKWSQSELIQFIFRSAIRNEEEIEIYIPSFRMRSLLYEYLNSLS